MSGPATNSGCHRREGRGIGRAIAEELSQTHQVIATYNSNKGAAESLAHATGAAISQCNLADATSRRNFLEELSSRFGPVDLLGE